MNNAKATTNDDSGKGLPAWQKAQIKEAHGVFKRILDPLMLFSEILVAYGESKGNAEFTTEEIAAAVRLLALGGYADLMSFGRSRYTFGEGLKDAFEEWLECAKEWEGGAE
jgi:hypothetical protein